jgi:uncharacterized protein (TIGR00730 family)
MSELRSICVYCGSNTGNDPEFAVAARTLGRMMAEGGVRLVYGGGSVGLMGILARTVLSEGGEVTGIIPQFLRQREVMLGEVTELIVTADMHERKRIMFERADSFLALPGGIGTLEEVVEIMTWAQLEQHAKPILIANLKGFWDPLVDLFRQMARQGFLSKAFLGSQAELPVKFINRIEEAIPVLRTALAGISRDELAATGRAPLM